MVQVRQVTNAEMWDLYVRDMLEKIVHLSDRIVAHNREGQANNPDGYEIVWTTLP